MTVYDTLDHQIGGVSQQQGAGASLTFTSQHGTVPVASLPVVSIDGVAQKAPAQTATPPSPSRTAPSRLRKQISLQRSSGWPNWSAKASCPRKSLTPRSPSF